MPPPSRDKCEEFTDRIFREVDKNRDKSISLKEYDVWIKNNYELQDFFLLHANF